MKPLTYISLTFLFAMTYISSFAQCTVPSSNPNKFVVVESAKEEVAENDGKKYLSGGVILQINGYQVKADSVVIFPATKNFEAYGNVVLQKKDVKFVSASSVFYREDAPFLNFMNNVISYYGNQPAIAKSSATYDVSQ